MDFQVLLQKNFFVLSFSGLKPKDRLKLRIPSDSKVLSRLYPVGIQTWGLGVFLVSYVFFGEKEVTKVMSLERNFYFDVLHTE